MIRIRHLTRYVLSPLHSPNCLRRLHPLRLLRLLPGSAAAALRAVRSLAAGVERLDARADCALRVWARPHAARLRALVQRVTAANREDALTRHLPGRAAEHPRADDRFGGGGGAG
ncbi:hypothetical protein ACFVVX_11340 [Kitasatospora sp. NPDC058170]|uniref:hypothetical protein n=1 Tax=Kitasatospora sp. NPDC058170 TaxID=3346364 RepID=UPI0036DD3A57